MTSHVPVPNLFTIEPTIEITAELYDGSKVVRDLTMREFIEWKKNGENPEDLVEDDDA